MIPSDHKNFDWVLDEKDINLLDYLEYRFIDVNQCGSM
jgi:hypothetical protein